MVGAMTDNKITFGKAFPKLNYDSLHNVASPLEQSIAGQELFNECIEAYGGLEYLKSIKIKQLDVRYSNKDQKQL